MSFRMLSWCQKTNGSATVGTLYKEPLGGIVVHYGNICKIKKGLRWGIYSIIESILLYAFKIFSLLSYLASLQGVYYFLLLLFNGSMSKTPHMSSIAYNCLKST